MANSLWHCWVLEMHLIVTSTFSEKQYYLAKENVDSIETLLIDHFSFLFTAFQVNIPFHKLTLAMFSKLVQ